MNRQKNRVIVIGGIVLGLLLLLPLSAYTSVKFFYLIYAQRYFTLFFGVLIALYTLKPNSLSRKLENWTIKHFFIIKIIVIPCLIGLLWITPAFMSQSFNTGLGLLIAGIIAVLLIFLASKNQGLVLDIPIVKNILEYIGGRSYGIYLCHLHFIRLRPTLLSIYHNQLPEWFKTGFWGICIQYVLIWIGMIVCSELLFRLLERPFMTLGKAYIEINSKHKQVKSL